jgi:CopG family nickel-responsive transcriptional regulator
MLAPGNELPLCVGIGYDESMSRTSNGASVGVERITISLPRETFSRLDRMVRARGYANRSQAVAEMIGSRWVELAGEEGDGVMAGTITLVYDVGRRNLAAKLTQIQRRFLAEVVSSQRVQLEHGYMLEVVLVQGPARVLRRIADRFVACKGVAQCSLTLTSHVLPPLHAG